MQTPVEPVFYQLVASEGCIRDIHNGWMPISAQPLKYTGPMQSRATLMSGTLALVWAANLSAASLEGVRLLTPSQRTFERIELALRQERPRGNPFDPNQSKFACGSCDAVRQGNSRTLVLVSELLALWQ